MNELTVPEIVGVCAAICILYGLYWRHRFRLHRHIAEHLADIDDPMLRYRNAVHIDPVRATIFLAMARRIRQQKGRV